MLVSQTYAPHYDRLGAAIRRRLRSTAAVVSWRCRERSQRRRQALAGWAVCRSTLAGRTWSAACASSECVHPYPSTLPRSLPPLATTTLQQYRSQLSRFLTSTKLTFFSAENAAHCEPLTIESCLGSFLTCINNKKRCWWHDVRPSAELPSVSHWIRP